MCYKIISLLPNMYSKRLCLERANLYILPPTPDPSVFNWTYLSVWNFLIFLILLALLPHPSLSQLLNFLHIPMRKYKQW